MKVHVSFLSTEVNPFQKVFTKYFLKTSELMLLFLRNSSVVETNLKIALSSVRDAIIELHTEHYRKLFLRI